MAKKKKPTGGMEIHLSDVHIQAAVRMYLNDIAPNLGSKVSTVELGAEKTGVFGGTAGVKAVVVLIKAVVVLK